MTDGRRLGILGGTLDPIHVGHLDAALAAREALRLDRVLVIPAHIPPHRARPATSSFHRFAMASIAIGGLDGFVVSDMELLAPGPSYTADTLLRVRQAYDLAASQIYFITGADAFAEIATWSRYPDVLDLANFVVVSRPGLSVSALRQRLPELRTRMRLPIGNLAASSTPASTSIFLVDAPTTDVSSTDIRGRVAAGASVAGLVPQGVEHHIRQHGLYAQPSHASSAADHLHGQN